MTHAFRQQPRGIITETSGADSRPEREAQINMPTALRARVIRLPCYWLSLESTMASSAIIASSLRRKRNWPASICRSICGDVFSVMPICT